MAAPEPIDGDTTVAAARGGPTHDSVRLGVGIAPAGHVRDSEGGSTGVES